jgi:anthranilate synthase/aminodeoxychorismate synthase-like glutamine amidotransferase
MILVIDNYDSFTYNLVQMISTLTQEEILVKTNDDASLKQLHLLSPSAIILSPGPGKPDSAGLTKEIIKTYSGKIPILGICLGLQCIAEVFGGKVEHATSMKHGIVDVIHHNSSSLFHKLPPQFNAVRYHSLSVNLCASKELQAIAVAPSDQTIMAAKHISHTTIGLQFHPESYGTEYGSELIQNFLILKEEFNGTLNEVPYQTNQK